jgi:predicted ribonuclease YlaK
MRKTFVLDTNVLLHDPRALARFEDNDVVIPIEGVEIDPEHQGSSKVLFCRSETLRQLPPELQNSNGDNNILAAAGGEPAAVLLRRSASATAPAAWARPTWPSPSRWR